MCVRRTKVKSPAVDKLRLAHTKPNKGRQNARIQWPLRNRVIADLVARQFLQLFHVAALRPFVSLPSRTIRFGGRKEEKKTLRSDDKRKKNVRSQLNASRGRAKIHSPNERVRVALLSLICAERRERRCSQKGYLSLRSGRIECAAHAQPVTSDARRSALSNGVIGLDGKTERH